MILNKLIISVRLFWRLFLFWAQQYHEIALVLYTVQSLDFEETINLLGKEDNFKFAAVTKLLLKWALIQTDNLIRDMFAGIANISAYSSPILRICLVPLLLATWWSFCLLWLSFFVFTTSMHPVTSTKIGGGWWGRERMVCVSIYAIT